MRGLNHEYLCIYLTQRIQALWREKAFALPEDALRKEIEKQNQHRLAKIGDGMMKMQIVKINF